MVTRHRSPSRHRMRRNARRLRRYGIEPMAMVTDDLDLGSVAAAVITRWLWRYRSELAPVCLSITAALAAWVLHAAHPRWWPLILAVTISATPTLAFAGHRLGLAWRAERIYAAAVTAAVGAWLAAAVALGPARTAAAANPARRRAGARGAVVGASPPARQGPGRTQARRVARDRPSDRAGRVPRDVGGGGRVGMARPLRPGARPDHPGRDRQASRHRIRAWHLPRRGARLPNTGRPGQPFRAASAGHRPARRRHRLARPGRSPRSRSRSTSGRSRTPPRPACCCYAVTP